MTVNSSDTARDHIENLIEKNAIMLFMKGNKLMPQCGFSAQVVQILDHLKATYETENVLENEFIRQAIKDYSDWPTIPQLYINGEFIGGCDIVTEMFETGELQELLNG